MPTVTTEGAPPTLSPECESDVNHPRCFSKTCACKCHHLCRAINPKHASAPYPDWCREPKGHRAATGGIKHRYGLWSRADLHEKLAAPSSWRPIRNECAKKEDGPEKHWACTASTEECGCPGRVLIRRLTEKRLDSLWKKVMRGEKNLNG